MAYRQGENYQRSIFYLTDQTVITYPVSPLAATIRCQPFSVLAGILTLIQVLINSRFYHTLRVLIEFLKLLIKPFCRFYAILHKSNSFHNSEMGLLFFPFFTYSS